MITKGLDIFVLAIRQCVRQVFLCEMAVLFWFNVFLSLTDACGKVNLYIYDVYDKQ
jgi:hypothetical protein